MTGRRGAVSLPELILVSWLFGLVLAGLAGFAASAGRLARVERDRLRAAEVVRTAAVVLGGELRYLGGDHLLAVAPDSLRVRAVRGSGVVCGGSGPELVVRYRGVRRPEPEKDSVLLLGVDPVTGTLGVEVGAVEDVAGGPSCGDPGLRITVRPAPARRHALVLVYETGTYALTGRALRYRLGAAGRQPLTEAVLERAVLGDGAGSLGLRLALDPDSLPRLSRLSWSLRLGPLERP